jgi:hypothetical protein
VSSGLCELCLHLRFLLAGLKSPRTVRAKPAAARLVNITYYNRCVLNMRD